MKNLCVYKLNFWLCNDSILSLIEKDENERN